MFCFHRYLCCTRHRHVQQVCYDVDFSITNGPLTRYNKLQVAHAPGMPGTFSPSSRVSDPDMHHDTCVMHVPWCMSGSLTSDFHWDRWRVKRSRHSRRMRNPRFYLETNGIWVPSPLSNFIGVLLRVVFFMPAIPVTPGYIKPIPHRHYYVKFMKHPWSLRNTAWFNMYAPMIVLSALSDQIHVVHTHARKWHYMW